MTDPLVAGLFVLARVVPALGLLWLGWGPPWVAPLLAVALCPVLVPALAARLLAAPSGGVALWIFFEVGVGATLGLCAAVPLYAARGAGALVDATLGERDGPVARLWGVGAVVGFFALSGPESVLAALARSYEVLPPGGAVGAGLWLLPGRLFVLALQFAAPVVGAVLLGQLIFSLWLRPLFAGRPDAEVPPAAGRLLGVLAVALGTLPALHRLGVELQGLRPALAAGLRALLSGAHP